MTEKDKDMQSADQNSPSQDAENNTDPAPDNQSKGEFKSIILIVIAILAVIALGHILFGKNCGFGRCGSSGSCIPASSSSCTIEDCETKGCTPQDKTCCPAGSAESCVPTETQKK